LHNAQAIDGLRVVPAKRLATETPVFPDRLFLTGVQIAPRQAAAEVAAVAAVMEALREVTVLTTGFGILIVPDQTIRMSRGSTKKSISQRRGFPCLCLVL